MGRSDSFIFQEYERAISEIRFNSVAFLGFSDDNSFTQKLLASKRDFYDLSLKNWNINDDWKLSQNYDLIVCTRCAYFSKNPDVFIDKCLKHLNPGGTALIDWGLGDHWRFKNYKVGWVRNGEREYAYADDNFLYSCYWHDDLEKDANVKAFWSAVRNNPNFGYSLKQGLSEVIKEECPAIVNYQTKKLVTKFLWPDSPQLYIITLITKDEVF